MLLDTKLKPPRTKKILVRMTEEEFEQVMKAVNETGWAGGWGWKPLSQNEFCRRAIFEKCGEQER